MPTQQIAANLSRASMFLVLTVNEGSEDEAREFFGEVSGLTRSVAFRDPSADLINVVGIGAELWERLFAAPKPEFLHPFKEVRGATHTAVSTPGDILIHLRAARLDLCFELAGLLLHELKGHCEVVDEVHGFSYFDNRDLLGFVDGTENPELHRANSVIRIPDGEHVGGSYVIVQKYLHDMDAWNSLSDTEQANVIGRTKVHDVELPDDVKPSNSHVALNDITDADGNKLEVFRLNMPFGTMTDREFGTYFIAYAKDPSITEQMLENMFIGDPVGNHDRILDFSTAHTGSLYFCPSYDFLESMPDLPAADDSAAETGSAQAPQTPVEPHVEPLPVDQPTDGDRSLGIGSLR